MINRRRARAPRTRRMTRVSDRKSILLFRSRTHASIRAPPTRYRDITTSQRQAPVLQRVRQRRGPELRQRDHGSPHHASTRSARRPLLHLLRRRRARPERPAAFPRDAAERLRRGALERALAGVRRALGCARALLQRLRQRRGSELWQLHHRPPHHASSRTAGRTLADRLRRRRQRADGDEGVQAGHRRVRGEGARAAGQRHLRRRAATTA